MELNETERWIAINALRVAAEQYDKDARQLRGPVPYDKAKNERMAAQFDKQAKDARELADKIEGGE